ncbi:MAG: hypothetical protein WAU88_02245 [Candidatus Zixiibacteriota bacterium]
MRLAIVAVLATAIMTGFLMSGAARATEPKPFKGRIEHSKELVVKPGKSTILLTVHYPKGYHYTSEAPTSFDWKSADTNSIVFPKSAASFSFTKITFPISIPIKSVKGRSEITIDASLFFCENKSGVCLFDNVRLIVPIRVDKSGLDQLPLTLDASVPGGKEEL